MAESEEELHSLLIKVKEESEKAGLKLTIQKMKVNGIQSHHFMANRWGKKMERVADFTFLSSKITADRDCSHDIKRHSFLGRKSRPKHHFDDKGPYSQSYGFSSRSCTDVRVGS